MKKYIVTAKNKTDIINLALNTRGVDLHKVAWDWRNASLSEDEACCENEDEILVALANGDCSKIDEMIMGGDVPVGGMVVVFDKNRPKNGFVCGNGTDWLVRNLKTREANAIVYAIFNKKGESK